MHPPDLRPLLHVDHTPRATTRQGEGPNPAGPTRPRRVGHYSTGAAGSVFRRRPHRAPAKRPATVIVRMTGVSDADVRARDGLVGRRSAGRGRGDRAGRCPSAARGRSSRESSRGPAPRRSRFAGHAIAWRPRHPAEGRDSSAPSERGCSSCVDSAGQHAQSYVRWMGSTEQMARSICPHRAEEYRPGESLCERCAWRPSCMTPGFAWTSTDAR